MKISCFVMMQNESPILDPFLDQIDALFDQCILLDHQSTDNSVEMAQKRDPQRYQIRHLKTSGHPQSELATWFAHALFSNGETDYLFFLDCDEFLPFADRRALEAFLSENNDADVIRLPWLNVYPESFEGGDIFSSAFYHVAPSGSMKKVILNKSIAHKSKDFVVSQGYHLVRTPDDAHIETAEINNTYLIHIPVQSLMKFSFKVANGSNRLIHDESRRKKGFGSHWVKMGQQLAITGFSHGDLKDATLQYSELPSSSNVAKYAEKLDFSFPYVKSPYRETSSYILSQISGMVHYNINLGRADASFFSVSDSSGNILFTNETTPNENNPKKQNPPLKDAPSSADAPQAASDLSGLIETLFALPLSTPGGTQAGPLHFLLLLLKLLRPRSSVLVGRAGGRSLSIIREATVKYYFESNIYYVDTSEESSEAPAPETGFPACIALPSKKAWEHFNNGTVDVLYLEDPGPVADKDYLELWYNTLSVRGVVIFQNIRSSPAALSCFKNLKKSFFTLELNQPDGLGIVFLNQNDPRIAPILSLAKDEKAFAVYNEFVHSILNLHADDESRLAAKETEICQLNETVRSMQTEIGQLFESRQIAVDQLNQTIESKQAEIDRLNQVFRSAQDEIGRLSQSISALKEEIALRISDVKALKSGMDSMRSSLSWKVTAPLRASKGLAHRIRSGHPDGGAQKNAARPDRSLPLKQTVAKSIFIDTPYGNTGDKLIGQGCLSFLHDMKIPLEQPDPRLIQAALDGDHASLSRSLEKHEGYIFFSGGGNIGIYKENENVRANIIRHAKNAKGFLVFPQSCFAPEDSLKSPGITVWAREKSSYDLLQKAGIRTALVPDAAFYMEDAVPVLPDGEGCFFVRRSEGCCSERVEHPLRISCPSQDLTLNQPLEEVIRALSPYRCVMSDRLHGAIISVLMHKRTALLPVAYHKNESFYDTWFKEDDGIGFIRNEEDLGRFLKGNAVPKISPKVLFLKYALLEFENFLNG